MNVSRILISTVLITIPISLINMKMETINKGLIAHWDFESISDKHLIDQSEFKSNGKIFGEPGKAKGIIGNSCLELDGKNDYIEIAPEGKTPQQIQKLEVGSISIWFKAKSIPVGKSISPLLYYGNENGCKNMFDASNEGLIIELAHGKVFKQSKGIFFTIFSNSCDLPSFCYDSHSDPHLHDEQGIIEENQWYHFVAVVDKNGNTGYLNGDEIFYRRYNFNNKFASQFFADARKHERMMLGKGFWNHAKETYFDGFLDDIRIYNRALDKSEVSELYNMANK